MPAVLFQTILRHSAACVGVRFPEWGRSGAWPTRAPTNVCTDSWWMSGACVSCSPKRLPVCDCYHHSSRCLMWPFCLFNTWVHYDRWAMRRIMGAKEGAAPLNGIFNFTRLLISRRICDCVTEKGNQSFWGHIKQKAINQHTVVNFCINTSTAAADCFLIFISAPAVLLPARTLKRICP